MTTADANSAAVASVKPAETDGSSPAGPHPDPPAIPKKAKNQNIRVSPTVLDAAGKDGDELLQSLRTAPAGLTQTEAEERARIAPLRAEIQRLDLDISRLGTTAAALELRLADPELYAAEKRSALTQLLAEQAEVRRQLSAAEEAWLAAGEALERAASGH